MITKEQGPININAEPKHNSSIQARKDDDLSDACEIFSVIARQFKGQKKPSLQMIQTELRQQIIEHKSIISQDTRPFIWKVLLPSLSIYSAAEYQKQVLRGPSLVATKIRLDIDRTFKHDPDFKLKSDNGEKLYRLLNSFAWFVSLEEDGNGSRVSITSPYVQGMNVIAGVLIYVMPELDAYNCFKYLATTIFPRILQPDLSGVHKCLRLVDTYLNIVDSELSQRLAAKKIMPEMWAFARKSHSTL